LFIGLKSKKYNKEIFIKVEENQIEKRTWEENYNSLMHFIDEKKRLPYSYGDQEEIRLYRYINFQINKNNNDEQKSNMIQNLIAPYLSNTKKRREKQVNNVIKEHNETHTDRKIRNVSNRWWDSFNDLKKYLQEKNRYPKAGENRSLYSFCYLCHKKIEDGTLHELQIDALKELKFDFKSESQKSWDENFEELKEFYYDKNHWPKSSNSREKESKLYRFCNSIFTSFKNEELTENHIKKLDSIKFPLNQGSASNKWLENYEKLKEFRKINPTRWPHARGLDFEKPIYQFCYRNKNSYINGTLEDYKVQLLNDLNFDFYG
jgi:hypothetical protein